MDIKLLTIPYYNNGFPTMKDHAEWYVFYHLEIVERIAYDIANHYDLVDFEILDSLIWLHDFDKAVDGEKNPPEQALLFLKDNGYNDIFIHKLREHLLLFEQVKLPDFDRSNLDLIPIEVRITLTADALSHYTSGPNGFLSIRAKQTKPNEDLSILHEWDIKKREKDKRKVCLDEYRSYIDDIEFGYDDNREIWVRGPITQYLTSVWCK